MRGAQRTCGRACVHACHAMLSMHHATCAACAPHACTCGVCRVCAVRHVCMPHSAPAHRDMHTCQCCVHAERTSQACRVRVQLTCTHAHAVCATRMCTLCTTCACAAHAHCNTRACQRRACAPCASLAYHLRAARASRVAPTHHRHCLRRFHKKNCFGQNA